MNLSNFMKPALFGAALLCAFASYGQGRGFLPLGTMPMYYNSSMAGQSEGVRFNSAFAFGSGRNPGTNFSKNQRLNYHASYDQFIPALRSGIGVSLYRGTEAYSYDYISFTNGGASLRHDSKSHFNGFSLAIAPKFSIKGKYTISPSMDFSYGRGQKESYYPDEFDKPWDERSGDHEGFTSRVGLLFNTNKYYVGYSVNLINKRFHNNQRVFNGQDRFMSVLQLGYTFQRTSASKFSFTPQLAFLISDYKLRPFSFINGTLSFRYDKFIAGMHTTGFHLGWQTEKLRVMLWNDPFEHPDKFYGSGILSCRYIFKD